MSGNAHRGDHDVAFYEATIGETRELAVSDAYAQLPDDDGPLAPARYVIQLVALSDDNAVVWVHVGPFGEGDLGGAAGPGNSRFPLSSGVVAETHVLEGESDRIGAIADTPGVTARLFISRVSTVVRKGRS